MGRRPRVVPRPTEADVPSDAEIEDWLIWDGDCESTDGCRVDPDGYCQHGHASWLVYLGLI